MIAVSPRHLCAACCALLVGLAACANPAVCSGSPLQRENRDMAALFGEEMRDAAMKMRWRGERLTEDTAYALALSGLSWMPEWGRLHRFTGGAQERESQFESARQDGSRKEAVAYAVSVLLAPDERQVGLPERALRYLEREGADVDRVMLGALEAPEGLPGLPGYTYSAAAILSARAVPRLLPFLLQLAESRDAYLRSRAIIGLGKLAYRGQRRLPREAFPEPLSTFGLSSGELATMQRAFLSAAGSDNYRVRAAAALALAMASDERAPEALRRLARDPAYITGPTDSGDRRERRIDFPVRDAAAAGLRTFGEDAETGSGLFSGRELRNAERGGRDVTNDRGGLRRDQLAQVFITELDRLFAVPLEHERGRDRRDE